MTTKTLADRLKSKEFKLGVKQHAAVLEFITAIQEAMQARDVSQQALATKLGKSRAWISKVLRRKPNITFFTAVELADALDLKMNVSFTARAQPAQVPQRVQELQAVTINPLAANSPSFTARATHLTLITDGTFDRAA